MEIRSSSVVLFIQVSVGCEWNIVSIFSVDDASREIFVFFGRSLHVNGWFSVL